MNDLSRAKLSNGLDLLKTFQVIEPGPRESRSTYRLADYDPARGWAKFPVRSMYSVGRIIAFKEFKLRRVVELDALKLFFLFVARRDQRTNFANIGYEKIVEYAGVKRDRIESAISFLASLSLVYVEHVPSKANLYGVSNAYRIVGIDPTVHMGTRGRNTEVLPPEHRKPLLRGLQHALRPILLDTLKPNCKNSGKFRDVADSATVWRSDPIDFS